MNNYELVIDGEFSRTTIDLGFGSPLDAERICRMERIF